MGAKPAEVAMHLSNTLGKRILNKDISRLCYRLEIKQYNFDVKLSKDKNEIVALQHVSLNFLEVVRILPSFKSSVFLDDDEANRRIRRCQLLFVCYRSSIIRTLT